MMVWMLLHPKMTPEHLGLLPGMLDENDQRPAKEQFDGNYAHGGGWRPYNGFKLTVENHLTHPGDPPLRPLAITHLRGETILFYDHSWVVVVQPDRTFEACRMD
jgi:hypothetical protein